MKNSLTTHRNKPDTLQTEKAFYKRIEQDLYAIRNARKSAANIPARQMVSSRIERIQFAIPLTKHVTKKLLTLLKQYELLAFEIQNSIL